MQIAKAQYEVDSNTDTPILQAAPAMFYPLLIDAYPTNQQKNLSLEA